jgi:hypothetical protein
MSSAMVARIGAVLIAVSLANLVASSCSDVGSFLGSTCSGFVDAADMSDLVKLKSYKNIIRLVQQK